MIPLQPHPEGLIIEVRALPGARRNAFRGTQSGAIKIAVTQVAEKGKANRALRACLAELLQLKKSQVELCGGELSPQKRFLIRDITAEQLQNRLQHLINAAGSIAASDDDE